MTTTNESSPTMTQPSLTPELDKQREIIESGRASLLQEFLDWLPQNGFLIAARCTDPIHEDSFATCGTCEGTSVHTPWVNPEQIMADFFGIDRNKIEDERRAILERIRAQNPEG